MSTTDPTHQPALERLAQAILDGRLRLTPDHIEYPGQQPTIMVWIAPAEDAS